MFWRLTPFVFQCCVQGYNRRRERQHDSDAWMMYHAAMLSRADTDRNKIPPLENFLSDSQKLKKSAVKGIDESAIMGWLKRYKNEYDKNQESKPT